MSLKLDGGTGSWSTRINNHIAHRYDIWRLLPLMRTSVASIKYTQHEPGFVYPRREVTYRCDWCNDDIKATADQIVTHADIWLYDDPYDVETVKVHWHRACAIEQRDELTRALA